MKRIAVRMVSLSSTISTCILCIGGVMPAAPFVSFHHCSLLGQASAHWTSKARAVLTGDQCTHRKKEIPGREVGVMLARMTWYSWSEAGRRQDGLAGQANR